MCSVLQASVLYSHRSVDSHGESQSQVGGRCPFWQNQALRS